MKNLFCYFSILVMFLVFSYGCAKNTSVLNPSSAVIADSLVINTENPMLAVYFTATSTFDSEGKIERLYGYNDRNHSIDVIKFNQGVGNLESMIKLQSSGPEGLDEIKYIEYISIDSLLIASRENVVILNPTDDGKWLFNFDVSTDWRVQSGNSLTRFYEPFLRSHTGRNGYFSKENKKFYFPLNYFGSDRFGSPEYYGEDVYLFGSFALKDKKIDLLEIRYPNMFRENFYGELGTIFCSFKDDILYYGFFATPDIYRFDLKENKNLEVVTVEEIKYPAPVPLQSGDDLTANVKDAFMFSNIYVNPVNEHLYRAYDAPVEGTSAKVDLYFIDVEEGVDYKLPPYFTAYGVIFDERNFYLYKYGDQEDRNVFYSLEK